jgi:hypothetical protein
LNIDTDLIVSKLKSELYKEFGDKIYIAVDKIPEIYSLVVKERMLKNR